MAKCEFCDKGVTFGIQVSHSHRPPPFQPYLEAQREAREGDREGCSHPRIRLHQMPPFR